MFGRTRVSEKGFGRVNSNENRVLVGGYSITRVKRPLHNIISSDIYTLYSLNSFSEQYAFYFLFLISYNVFFLFSIVTFFLPFAPVDHDTRSTCSRPGPVNRTRSARDHSIIQFDRDRRIGSVASTFSVTVSRDTGVVKCRLKIPIAPDARSAPMI